MRAISDLTEILGPLSDAFIIGCETELPTREEMQIEVEFQYDIVEEEKYIENEIVEVIADRKRSRWPLFSRN